MELEDNRMKIPLAIAEIIRSEAQMHAFQPKQIYNALQIQV